MGCHFLLQEIFPTQGLNPGLPHCRQMLYHLYGHSLNLDLPRIFFTLLYLYPFLIAFFFFFVCLGDGEAHVYQYCNFILFRVLTLPM